MFNIGAQGQFIFGAIGASYVGFNFEMSPLIHVLLVLLAGIICGGIFGGIVGLLKAKTGAHEVIVTIMLNYVAALFILWLLKTSVFLRPERFDPIAPDVNLSARLPKLLGADLRLHLGIFSYDYDITALALIAMQLRYSVCPCIRNCHMPMVCLRV